MKTLVGLSFLSIFLLISCSKENLYNESASFADSTKITRVLEEKVITAMADRKKKTISTLYGNDIASEHARNSADHQYPSGSELSLVTWSQKEDIQWYGANIPGEIKSIEIVKYQTPDSATLEHYEGKTLQLRKTNFEISMSRIGYISGLRGAVLP
ncbi:cytochrome P460 family protein [Dyadobacter sp. 3J3]|uniref:cytochrome P460 family protein n=1 Tax=Dyadobacter sp. 3J3 TaxID=2606600 RepID=UPI00135A0DEF|nr:cytochrome P460 family protein [Dyadobacter sp. 3J3]